jgi:polyisoprenoid-binding protein YceI
MLKRGLMVGALMMLVVGSIQANQWKVDPVHSSVQFRVSHLVIAKVVGGFSEFSADMEFDGTDIATGKVEMTIAVASVNTENENRDKHLRSSDFFEAEKYPQITFKSKKVVKGEGNKFQLVGDMTMRGVTKEVTFDCEYNGSIEMRGTMKSGFTATTTINRQDFGVSYGQILDNGGLAVGNDVEITLELEFNQVS